MKLNICYLILNLIWIFTLKIYVKRKKITNDKKMYILAIYLFTTVLTYSYLNEIFNKIFGLNYLNVKLYLLQLITTNIIIFYIKNTKKTTWIYQTLNYLYFIINTILLLSILSISLGSKFEMFYMMDIQNAIHLMNISIILFIIYLIVIQLTYITSNIEIEKIISYLTKPKERLLTPYEIINYHNKKNLIIAGVDCSIIFEDSNQENIIKNYYLLNKNIHTKLTNGYTLKENKILKSICTKLKVSNLWYIDMNNENLLHEINEEEYQLLKKVLKN